MTLSTGRLPLAPASGPGRPRTDSAVARALGLATLAAAGVAALLQAAHAKSVRRAQPLVQRPVMRRGATSVVPGAASPGSASSIATRSVGSAPSGPALPATRGLHGAAALLATSVLADSALEHYRGSFENPAMYTPLLTSTLTLLAGVHGAASGPRHPSGPDRPGPVREDMHASGRARQGVYATAIAVGAAGTAFHGYNILKRPGGLGWLNLFYAAPIGAPAALSLAGLIGLAADRLRQTPADKAPRLLGLPAGRALAGLTSLGLLGTVGEAGLLHFRGAFQNPFMWLPVTVPPAAAALLAKAALGPAPGAPPRFARAWLALTALLGIAGMGFHAYGVSRAMGGWRNWSQNVLDGPPLPAPPSFSALALAGLSALSLLERGKTMAAGRGRAAAAPVDRSPSP